MGLHTANTQLRQEDSIFAALAKRLRNHEWTHKKSITLAVLRDHCMKSPECYDITAMNLRAAMLRRNIRTQQIDGTEVVYDVLSLGNLQLEVESQILSEIPFDRFY